VIGNELLKMNVYKYAILFLVLLELLIILINFDSIKLLVNYSLQPVAFMLLSMELPLIGAVAIEKRTTVIFLVIKVAFFAYNSLTIYSLHMVV